MAVRVFTGDDRYRLFRDPHTAFAAGYAAEADLREKNAYLLWYDTFFSPVTLDDYRAALRKRPGSSRDAEPRDEQPSRRTRRSGRLLDAEPLDEQPRRITRAHTLRSGSSSAAAHAHAQPATATRPATATQQAARPPGELTTASSVPVAENVPRGKTHAQWIDFFADGIVATHASWISANQSDPAPKAFGAWLTAQLGGPVAEAYREAEHGDGNWIKKNKWFLSNSSENMHLYNTWLGTAGRAASVDGFVEWLRSDTNAHAVEKHNELRSQAYSRLCEWKSEGRDVAIRYLPVLCMHSMPAVESTYYIEVAGTPAELVLSISDVTGFDMADSQVGTPGDYVVVNFIPCLILYPDNTVAVGFVDSYALGPRFIVTAIYEIANARYATIMELGLTLRRVGNFCAVVAQAQQEVAEETTVRDRKISEFAAALSLSPEEEAARVESGFDINSTENADIFVFVGHVVNAYDFAVAAWKQSYANSQTRPRMYDAEPMWWFPAYPMNLHESMTVSHGISKRDIDKVWKYILLSKTAAPFSPMLKTAIFASTGADDPVSPLTKAAMYYNPNSSEYAIDNDILIAANAPGGALGILHGFYMARQSKYTIMSQSAFFSEYWNFCETIGRANDVNISDVLAELIDASREIRRLGIQRMPFRRHSKPVPDNIVANIHTQTWRIETARTKLANWNAYIKARDGSVNMNGILARNNLAVGYYTLITLALTAKDGEFFPGTLIEQDFVPFLDDLLDPKHFTTDASTDFARELLNNASTGTLYIAFPAPTRTKLVLDKLLMLAVLPRDARRNRNRLLEAMVGRRFLVRILPYLSKNTLHELARAFTANLNVFEDAVAHVGLRSDGVPDPNLHFLQDIPAYERALGLSPDAIKPILLKVYTRMTAVWPEQKEAELTSIILKHAIHSREEVLAYAIESNHSLLFGLIQPAADPWYRNTILARDKTDFVTRIAAYVDARESLVGYDAMIRRMLFLLDWFGPGIWFTPGQIDLLIKAAPADVVWAPNQPRNEIVCLGRMHRIVQQYTHAEKPDFRGAAKHALEVSHFELLEFILRDLGCSVDSGLGNTLFADLVCHIPPSDDHVDEVAETMILRYARKLFAVSPVDTDDTYTAFFSRLFRRTPAFSEFTARHILSVVAPLLDATPAGISSSTVFSMAFDTDSLLWMRLLIELRPALAKDYALDKFQGSRYGLHTELQFESFCELGVLLHSSVADDEIIIHVLQTETACGTSYRDLAIDPIMRMIGSIKYTTNQESGLKTRTQRDFVIHTTFLRNTSLPLLMLMHKESNLSQPSAAGQNDTARRANLLAIVIEFTRLLKPVPYARESNSRQHSPKGDVARSRRECLLFVLHRHFGELDNLFQWYEVLFSAADGPLLEQKKAAIDVLGLMPLQQFPIHSLLNFVHAQQQQKRRRAEPILRPEDMLGCIFEVFDKDIPLSGTGAAVHAVVPTEFLQSELMEKYKDKLPSAFQ